MMRVNDESDDESEEVVEIVIELTRRCDGENIIMFTRHES